MIVELLYKKKLEEYYSHERKENVFYVTDLTRCPLKVKFEQEYRELALSEIFTPAGILGDLVHRGIQSSLNIEGYEAEVEVEKEKGLEIEGKSYIIKGRADIVLKSKTNNETLIIEIKTARRDDGLPQKHHILQLRLYLWLFEVNKGILLYVTPDRITEYIIEGALDTASVMRLVEENIRLAPAPRYIWECSYCIFAKLCPNKASNR
ncbi:MAG: CRISPR-associated protein Cas4 [Sulfolobaceae archaeon]